MSKNLNPPLSMLAELSSPQAATWKSLYVLWPMYETAEPTRPLKSWQLVAISILQVASLPWHWCETVRQRSCNWLCFCVFRTFCKAFLDLWIHAGLWEPFVGGSFPGWLLFWWHTYSYHFPSLVVPLIIPAWLLTNQLFINSILVANLYNVQNDYPTAQLQIFI